MEDLEVRFEAQVGTISTDPFETIKAWVAMAVEGSKDLVVCEENLKGFKDRVARYRKLKANLEDERKRLKNEYLAPYTDWESKYKEAVSELDETINNIGSQIRAIEDAQEAQRITSINDMILRDAEDIRKGLSETVKSNQSLWNRVCKKTYYNKSGSQVKNTEEWRTTLLGISRDLDVIEANPEKDQLFIAYLNRGDLASAMQEVADNNRRLNQMKESKPQPESKTPTVAEVQVEPEMKPYTVYIPSESIIPQDELKTAKALRWMVGPKWKIRILFKVAADLGITFASYEEKR